MQVLILLSTWFTQLLEMYKLKTAPSSEPISVAEAKLFLKVTQSSEDALIGNMIKAARQYLESYTKRSFYTQTWQYYADGFEDVIELYHGTVASITIKYYDTDGNEQTFTDFQSDLVSNPARVKPKPDYSWPSVQNGKLNVVAIEFVAGASSVDDKIIDAIYLLLGHIYANRQDVVVGHRVEKMPQGSEWLVSSLKLF